MHEKPSLRACPSRGTTLAQPSLGDIRRPKCGDGRRNVKAEQALETERRGIKTYETAVERVVNADLEKEWQEYREAARAKMARKESL
jgi:hypothetical protein